MKITRQHFSLTGLGIAAITLAMGVGVIGGAEGPSADPPAAASPTVSEGQPFLPVLYSQLASPASVPRQMCNPKTWQELLLPCDLPG